MTRGCVATLILLASQCLAAEQGVHPPYPDRWIWLPNGVAEEWAYTELRRMSSGDVLVAHGAEVESFFGRVSYPSVEAAFDSGFPPPDGEHRIALKDGSFALGLSGNACSEIGASISIRDEQDHELRSSAFVLLLDRPVHRQAVVCEEQEQEPWASPLVVLQPGALLLLDDGTFLVVDVISGVVLRLRADLRVSLPVAKAVDSQVLRNAADEFALPGPEYGLDWPAYFDSLRRSYFEESASAPDQ